MTKQGGGRRPGKRDEGGDEEEMEMEKERRGKEVEEEEEEGEKRGMSGGRVDWGQS